MSRWRLVGVSLVGLAASGAGCATGETLGDTSGPSDAALFGGPDTGRGGSSSGGSGAAGDTSSAGGAGDGGSGEDGGSSGGSSGKGSGGGSSDDAGGNASGGAGGSGAGGSGAGGANPCASGLKHCGTTCITPAPTNGCDGPCVACAAAPVNSTAACTAGQCDFTCASGYSKSGGACQADPTCTDKQKNGAETDMDCGGTLCPKCAPGLKCTKDADCSKGPCQSGVCGCTPATCTAAASCAASVDDGCGKKIDCSKSCASTTVCYQDKCCTAATTCAAKACGAMVGDGCGGTIDCSKSCTGTDVCITGTCCTPQACGTQCGHPTDGCGTTLDCGLCGDGKACKANTDCTSGACENGTCVSCTDGKKNHGETDTDCGGANCPTCANGKSCSASSDCQSGHCCAPFEIANGCNFVNGNKCE